MLGAAWRTRSMRASATRSPCSCRSPRRRGEGAIAGIDLQPRIQTFTVSGVFEVGAQEHDNLLAFVHLQDAAAIAGTDGAPGGLRLKFADIFAAPARVQRDCGVAGRRPRRPATGRSRTPATSAPCGIEKTMMTLILMLIVAVAAFNIVAALVMVVNEKRTDIAILRTVGITPRAIVGVFMTQGVIIGWFGALLGLALGLSLALNVGTIVPFLERLIGMHVFDPTVFVISRGAVGGALAAGHRHHGHRTGAHGARDDLSGGARRCDRAGRGVALRMKYELLIGRRYLRASRGNRFVSFISTISMAGVAIGVAVLIVVLSVMNGFEREVRERILSLTSHATHQRVRLPASRDWQDTAARVRDNPEVLAAAPYIEEQALLIAGSKSSGAVVTGVLPEEERKVTVDRRQDVTAARSTRCAPASTASCSATSSRRRSAWSSAIAS